MSGDLAIRPPATDGRRDPTTRPALRGWVLTGIAGCGFLLSALVVAAYLEATFGVQTVFLALAVAVVPLGIVIPTFLWLDRFESEPTRYLVVAFLWGALVAAVVAAVFNTGAIAVLEATTDPTSALATTAVVVAPFVEEAAKGALVLLVWRLRRREFDGITDGMVYAGICATGFAFTENIHYLATAYADGGGAALTGTFVLRCLLSPFAHPMFTILTGIGIGVAATSRTWPPRVVAPVAGYLLAVLAHALWNLAAVSGGQGLVVVYLLVEVPVFVAFLVFVGLGAAPRGPPHRPVPAPLRGCRVALARRGHDARVDATAAGGPGLGAGEHRSGRAGGDARVPGHRERARPAPPPDEPLGRRHARAGRGAPAAARPAVAPRPVRRDAGHVSDALDIAHRMGPELVALRRRLHGIPELGLHLPDTQAVVLDALSGLDLEVQVGESLSSVVAVLRGRAPAQGPRPVVLLRGDMDALPVTEEVDVEYASTRPGPHARVRSRPARGGSGRRGAGPRRAARRARRRRRPHVPAGGGGSRRC